MIKQTLFEEKIVKVDEDKYVFTRNFEAEMSKEDIDNNIKNIKNNIETLNKMINNLNIDKDIEEQSIKFDNDIKIRQEALDNYEQYFEENIKEIYNNKEKDKQDLKKFLDNSEGIKQKLLEKRRTSLLNEKETYEFQLKNELELLKVYDGY